MLTSDNISHQMNDVTNTTHNATGDGKNFGSKLGFFQSIFKGSLLGSVEVGINHPLWMIKTRLQNGKKFTLNPRVLYRGIGLNMSSTIPITTIQVATTELLSNGDRKTSLDSQFLKVANAFTGGALSATVSTGAELIMAQMNKERGFHKTCHHIISRCGFMRLNTGFFGTVMRDGIYTIGFMGAPEIIRNQLKQRMPNNDRFAENAAAPLSGVFSALLSQPFDTIKTRQQKVYQKNLSFLAVGKSLIKNNGFFSLYKGVTPRAGMIVSGITIMDKMSREFDKHYLLKAK